MVQIRPDDGMQGYLPSMAPLANPYVPFQGDNPPTYEARKARSMISGSCAGFSMIV